MQWQEGSPRTSLKLAMTNGSRVIVRSRLLLTACGLRRDVGDVLKQSERHAPCAAIAVDGGCALVDPNDFSDVPLEALVGEAHALADAEVLFVKDLWRPQRRCSRR